MAVVKNVIPKKYKNEEQRKKELKRIYVNIQRGIYLESLTKKEKEGAV